MTSRWFCWASMAGRHGMPTPEALVATGAWQLVRRHPRWPDSYLLERVA